MTESSINYKTKKLCIVSKAMDNKVASSATISAANPILVVYKHTFTGQASSWFHSWNINNLYSTQAIRLCIATFSNYTKRTPVEREESL